MSDNLRLIARDECGDYYCFASAFVPVDYFNNEDELDTYINIVVDRLCENLNMEVHFAYTIEDFSRSRFEEMAYAKFYEEHYEEYLEELEDEDEADEKCFCEFYGYSKRDYWDD